MGVAESRLRFLSFAQATARLARMCLSIPGRGYPNSSFRTTYQLGAEPRPNCDRLPPLSSHVALPAAKHSYVYWADCRVAASQHQSLRWVSALPPRYLKRGAEQVR